MIVQDEALVLAVKEYSESSQIVALWTEGHGRVTGIAKGIRRLGRAAFDGPFEPATRVEIGFYPRGRGEGLSVLSEASLRERYPFIRDSLEGWWAWSEASEALMALTQEMDPHPGLLGALEGLLKGESGLPSFLMRLLEATGHAPALDACAGCGRPLPERGRVGFAFWIGGAVCEACRRGPVAMLNAPLRGALRSAAVGGVIPVASLRQAEALLGRYVAHAAGGALSVPLCRQRARRVLARMRA